MIFCLSTALSILKCCLKRRGQLMTLERLLKQVGNTAKRHLLQRIDLLLDLLDRMAIHLMRAVGQINNNSHCRHLKPNQIAYRWNDLLWVRRLEK